MSTTDLHLLRQLVFPSRYEPLERLVGTEVAQLLVDPGSGTRRALELLSRGVQTRGEGAFVPLVARSGTGKTTLAENVRVFLPAEYAPTLRHRGSVTSADLSATVDAAVAGAPQDRIIPINIDDRENDPPTETELAAVKRFLRSDTGARSVIFWPETSETNASSMAEHWSRVGGTPPIDLPLRVEGPERDVWIQTALNTLRLSNQLIDDLELLGVDPRNYDPQRYGSIGEFLRAISGDFNRYVQELIEDTQVPLKLVIVFASESSSEGILSSVTSGSRFGFIDANAVVEITKSSKIGKWWLRHRGLLTQAVVRLDARALCLPPTASVPALRRYGPDDVRSALTDLDIADEGDARIARQLTRTDFGRLLMGQARSASEARGTPSTQAEPAFSLLAETHGFGGARDKPLNRALAQAIGKFHEREAIEVSDVTTEKAIHGLSLIPDIAVQKPGVTLCIEPTWRKGDFLIPAHRSTVAQYILQKLQNYCVALGWV